MLVSYGTSIFVQEPALEILTLATDGRITPQRYWRLCMVKGCWLPSMQYKGFAGIDYGQGGQAQGLVPAPRWNVEDVTHLEELGSVERVKQAIIHDSGYWVWMSPDR